MEWCSFSFRMASTPLLCGYNLWRGVVTTHTIPRAPQIHDEFSTAWIIFLTAPFVMVLLLSFPLHRISSLTRAFSLSSVPLHHSCDHVDYGSVWGLFMVVQPVFCPLYGLFHFPWYPVFKFACIGYMSTTASILSIKTPILLVFSIKLFLNRNPPNHKSTKHRHFQPFRFLFYLYVNPHFLPLCEYHITFLSHVLLVPHHRKREPNCPSTVRRVV